MCTKRGRTGNGGEVLFLPIDGMARLRTIKIVQKRGVHNYCKKNIKPLRKNGEEGRVYANQSIDPIL